MDARQKIENLIEDENMKNDYLKRLNELEEEYIKEVDEYVKYCDEK